MRLHETMQRATHYFHLDMAYFLEAGERGETLISPHFFDRVHQMECINILQNRKKFNIEKEKPTPAELRMRMSPVCSVTPALVMHQGGQGDSIGDRIIVRKQQCLVAWGSEESKSKFSRGPLTVVGTLLATKDRDGIRDGIMARIGFVG